MSAERLNRILLNIQNSLEKKDIAREKALELSRKVIKNCGFAIKAVHRENRNQARELLKETKKNLGKMRNVLKNYPEIFYSGIVSDAQKEYSEASIVYSIIYKKTIPEPEDLRVEYAPYLNGLGEVVGELRRKILDLIRSGRMDESESLLDLIEDIYYHLFSIDYPEAITGGLRRTVDVARQILEKTRGDLTNALSQKRLEKCFRIYGEESGGKK